MTYEKINVRLNDINKIFFCNLKDYYIFLEIIYSGKCMVNGNIISKKFKIYNLCDYAFNKKNIKKTQLFKDYILLKIVNIENNIKDDISSDLYEIVELLNEQIDINDNFIIDDFENLIYKLIVENNSNEDKISIEKMIDYIVSNTMEEYVVINDSSLFNIEKKDNLIIFDMNKNYELFEYNLLYYDGNLQNINHEVLLDNFYRYWPLPTEKNSLLCEINNNFLTIITKKNIVTYYDNYAILAKLISCFYGVKLTIIYKGKNNAIKSFLASALNY